MREREEARAGADFPEAALALMGINQPLSHLQAEMPKWPSLVSTQEKEQLAAARDGEEPCGEGRFVTICWQVVENNLLGQAFSGTVWGILSANEGK